MATTHRQVRLAPNVSLHKGVDQLPSYTKITQFDLAIAVNENVGRFHICKTSNQDRSQTQLSNDRCTSMQYFQLLLEEVKCFERLEREVTCSENIATCGYWHTYTFCHSSNHQLWNPQLELVIHQLVHFVEGPMHHFHAN